MSHMIAMFLKNTFLETATAHRHARVSAADVQVVWLLGVGPSGEEVWGPSPTISCAHDLMACQCWMVRSVYCTSEVCAVLLRVASTWCNSLSSIPAGEDSPTRPVALADPLHHRQMRLLKRHS